LFLVIWSFAGGAICRAAVMQFARDERIGLREAVRFAKEKFWGFFFAPVISLLFIAVLAVMLAIGGLVGTVPWVGDIIAGLLWFLAIVAGLGIAFIAIGTVAGGSLFGPVIAAEGSDAFDAISRAFVYIYSRPWKSLLYGFVLLVYGAICYIFVRFFVWLTLAAVHVFVGLGMFVARPLAGPGVSKLDLLWQMPSFTDLRPHVLDWSLLSGGEVILAALIVVWTYLLWGLMQSWFISFYFSGCSVAYLLLRRDVDAIDIEEIYLEEAEPEETPAQPAEQPSAEPAASAQGEQQTSAEQQAAGPEGGEQEQGDQTGGTAGTGESEPTQPQA